MTQAMSHSKRSVAPLLGAAGAMLAFAAATRRFGIHPEKAAFGGAALAFAASCATEGQTRAALKGAAAASLAFGLAGLGRVIQQAVAAQIPPVPSPPANAVTPADLQEALAVLQSKNAESAAERDRQYAAETGELQSMVRSLLDDLRISKEENARLRAAATSTRFDGGRRRPEDQTQQATMGANVGSCEPKGNLFVHSVAAEGPIAPAVVAHLAHVSSLLEDHERQRLSLFNATAPSSAVAASRQHLLHLTPVDAVTYLRRTVFPKLAPAIQVPS